MNKMSYEAGGGGGGGYGMAGTSNNGNPNCMNRNQNQYDYDDLPPAYNDQSNLTFTQPKQLTQEYIENLFSQIIIKYEINREFANRLQALSSFKTVFILDDSSSMNNILQDSPLNNGLMKVTRWNELQYFTNISIEIANLFNQNNCTDIYFLNKPPIKNIYNVEEFMNYFKLSKPNGYTPLSKILQLVLNDNVNTIKEKKLLVIILTDGEPTDDFGNNDIKGFKKSLLSRNPMNRIFVSIVACTDDEESVSYLNNWDKKIQNLDVVDDFRNERREILRVKGTRFRFTYGDYVVKTLLGSFDKDMDKLDEQKNSCLVA